MRMKLSQSYRENLMIRKSAISISSDESVGNSGALTSASKLELHGHKGSICRHCGCHSSSPSEGSSLSFTRGKRVLCFSIILKSIYFCNDCAGVSSSLDCEKASVAIVGSSEHLNGDPLLLVTPRAGVVPEYSNLIRGFSSQATAEAHKPPSPPSSPPSSPPPPEISRAYPEGARSNTIRVTCDAEKPIRSLKQKTPNGSKDAARAGASALFPQRKAAAAPGRLADVSKSNTKRGGIPVSGRTYDSKKANAVIEEALARARVILDRQEARTRDVMKHDTDEAAALLDLQGRGGGDGSITAMPTDDSSKSEEQQAVDAHLQLNLEKHVEFSYITPTDQVRCHIALCLLIKLSCSGRRR